MEILNWTALERAQRIAENMSKPRPKRPSEALSRTIVVSRDVLDLLQPEADARGISVNELCRRILGAVADDKLTKAIFDD